jgi:hypothetical protein
MPELSAWSRAELRDLRKGVRRQRSHDPVEARLKSRVLDGLRQVAGNLYGLYFCLTQTRATCRWLVCRLLRRHLPGTVGWRLVVAWLRRANRAFQTGGLIQRFPLGAW